MEASPVRVTRLDQRIDPDPSRVIARPLIPGGEKRIQGIIRRVLDIPENEALALLTQLEDHYRSNHPNI